MHDFVVLERTGCMLIWFAYIGQNNNVEIIKDFFIVLVSFFNFSQFRWLFRILDLISLVFSHF